MKITIKLQPNTFTQFKDEVAKAFPAWQVKQLAPVVYVNRNLTGATLFSLTDYSFSTAEVEQLNALAKQCTPTEEVPKQPFMPIYATRVQVRKARTKMPAVRRKKIKSMADAFR